MNVNELYPEDYGAKGDGLQDDTLAIEETINEAIASNSTVFLNSSKTYKITKNIVIKAGNKTVHIRSNGSGNNKARLLFDVKKGIGLDIQGEKVSEEVSLIKNTKATAKHLKISDYNQVLAGQLCEIISTKSWYQDPRPPTDPPHSWSGFNHGKAKNGSNNSLILADKFKAKKENVIGRSFTITQGKNTGYSATVTDYDDDKKEAFFTPSFSHKINKGDAYIFPQAFKGELNYVEKVYNESIELRNILFDGYHVEDNENSPRKEAVKVGFFNPTSVLMENIELEWVNQLKFSAFQMIRVLYGVDSIFRNVTIINASRMGFQIERCFNTMIESCGVKHSNNNFLGYGVNVQNATDTTVKNSWFWGCRRGVDFDSVRDFENAYPSRLGLVDSCINYGGGTRQENRKNEAPWYPEGNWDETKSRNFGFGSHGPADHITYSNNTVLNTYRGIFLRGTNERVINNKFIGKMEECIGIWFGGNHTIDGNEYIHPSITGTIDLESNYREVSTFDKNDFRNDLPKRFIGVATLNFSPTIYERGFLHIKNNSANAITEDFFYDQWSGGKFIEDVSIENNHIVFWPSINNSKTHLVNSNHSGDIVNFVDKNNYVNIMNSNFFAYSENHKFGDNCLVIPNNSHKRIIKKKLTNEFKIKKTINNLNRNDILESEKLLQLIIRPYSRLSSFQCNFSSTVLSSNDDTVILVSLCKGSIPIQSKFYHAPKANVPLNIEFNHLDTPRLHDKVTYSIRIASYSNEETELICNSQTYSILGDNYTTFIVKEI